MKESGIRRTKLRISHILVGLKICSTAEQNCGRPVIGGSQGQHDGAGTGGVCPYSIRYRIKRRLLISVVIHKGGIPV